MGDQWDAIVVGSGLGGLSAGACLAGAGKRVLVLERHDLAGGNATVFRRRHDGDEYEFDVGVHYLGDCGPGGLFPSILDSLAQMPADGAALSGWEPSDRAGELHERSESGARRPGEPLVERVACGDDRHRQDRAEVFFELVAAGQSPVRGLEIADRVALRGGEVLPVPQQDCGRACQRPGGAVPEDSQNFEPHSRLRFDGGFRGTVVLARRN